MVQSQPKDGYSVKIILPVPEKLLEDKEKIKVVYGNGMFGSEDSISREQLATMLRKYAGSPAAADNKGLAVFKDMGEISPYAKKRPSMGESNRDYQ